MITERASARYDALRDIETRRLALKVMQYITSCIQHHLPAVPGVDDRFYNDITRRVRLILQVGARKHENIVVISIGPRQDGNGSYIEYKLSIISGTDKLHSPLGMAARKFSEVDQDELFDELSNTCIAKFRMIIVTDQNSESVLYADLLGDPRTPGLSALESDSPDLGEAFMAVIDLPEIEPA